MSVPPPMLAMQKICMNQPPPKIEQIGTVATSIMQPTTMITQCSTPTMVTAVQQPSQFQVATSQPQAILQQQTIIPQTVPIQLQHGNMVIHQQPTNNLSVPPPNIIPMKQGLWQFSNF